MSRLAALLLLLGALLVPPPRAGAYPVDAWPATKIARLEAYRLVQEGLLPGRILYYGAQLRNEEIQLRLADRNGFTLPPVDAGFTARVTEILGDDAPYYGIAVIDLTDPDSPRYAAHNAGMLQNPGSVGKLAVALAWFQALADVYPQDIDARRRILRETQVTADDFIRVDEHDVPFWALGDPEVESRPIQEGDTANLWTWLDWMCSASSNAAAAVLQKQLLLLKHFGKEYPVPQEQAERFLAETPKAKLGRIFLDAMVRPLERNGLDPGALRQGSFFTRTGKERVPGVSSHASAGELAHYMLLMELGQLVDEWSSLEIKKLLYLTDSRVRYASSPALFDWAVYFKSGSLYSCRPEPGFVCEKYHGNKLNYMNSVAMVEAVDQTQKLHYVAAVLSNVLRRDSAELHQTLGTRIHELVQALHPAPPEPQPDPESLPWRKPPPDPETGS